MVMADNSLLGTLLPSRKLCFTFENSIYNCSMQIKDANGVRDFFVPLVSKKETDCMPSLAVEVCGESIEITITPVATDLQAHINDAQSDFEKRTWKDKLLFKFLSKALSAMDAICLRTACRYRIDDLPDHAMLSVRLFGHVRGNSALLDWFDIHPIIYMYYEINCGTYYLSPINVRALDRPNMIKSARNLILLNWGWYALLTYPLQMCRIKTLTKDMKILKALQKFYCLSPQKRQKLCARWGVDRF